MSRYSTSAAWSDIDPIPLSQPADPTLDLACIAYSDSYLEATSYLRAVMAVNEISERAISLTADIIAMNPAHYTVWLYRAKVLIELGEKNGDLNERLQEELEWLTTVARKNLKNYQIWYVLKRPQTP